MNEEKILTNIFKNLGVDFNKNAHLKKENLLGKKIGLSARDLLIAFFWIESAFNIRIMEESVVNGEFNTYEHILRVIRICQSIENN